MEQKIEWTRINHDAMATKMKLNRSNVTLEGNLLTGDTYRIKEFIKAKLDGKWDAERKGWIVNPEKMASIMDSGWCYIYPETQTPAPVKVERHISELCPKCHTYCYGDCEA